MTYDDWKLASPYEGEVNCDDFPDCIGCPEEDCNGYIKEYDGDASDL